MAEKPLKVIAGAPDRPLVIDDIELACYVLEGEIRVLSQRGLADALVVNGGGEMPRLVTREWIKPFVGNEITVVVKNPLLFNQPGRGKPAYGYPATLLIDICKAILLADESGRATSRQRSIVRNARVLLFGLAKTGIVALVDEVTGYQEIREKNALRVLLGRYMSDELQRWSKTFQYEFYEGLFRLKRWDMDPMSQRPSVVGRYTNDLVYRRLSPALLTELRTRNPVIAATGRRKHKHHQWFNPEHGHPELVRRIDDIILLMTAATTWDEFMYTIDRVFPAPNDTKMFAFPYDRTGSEFAG